MDPHDFEINQTQVKKTFSLFIQNKHNQKTVRAKKELSFKDFNSLLFYTFIRQAILFLYNILCLSPERGQFYNFSTLRLFVLWVSYNLFKYKCLERKKKKSIMVKSLIILSTILTLFFLFSIFLLIFYSYEKKMCRRILYNLQRIYFTRKIRVLISQEFFIFLFKSTNN